MTNLSEYAPPAYSASPDDVQFPMRCAAFGERPVGRHMLVDPEGNVLVFDGIADFYTNLHSLPAADIQRARRVAAALAELQGGAAQ